MNLQQVRVLLVAAACGLAFTAVSVAGSVTGQITYDGSVPKLGQGPYAPIDFSSDPACAKMHSTPVPRGELVLGDGNTLGNVFVQIKNPPAGSSAAASNPVIDLHGCIAEPRVTGVQAGQPLTFKNSDGILHNLRGMARQNPAGFNIGMPPALASKQVDLSSSAGVRFEVKCDVHPWMTAYVAVMTHPYFAVTGEDGTFKIDNVPDGVYDVEAWHGRLGARTAKATVSGGDATVDFSFTAPR